MVFDPDNRPWFFDILTKQWIEMAAPPREWSQKGFGSRLAFFNFTKAGTYNDLHTNSLVYHDSSTKIWAPNLINVFKDKAMVFSPDRNTWERKSATVLTDRQRFKYAGDWLKLASLSAVKEGDCCFMLTNLGKNNCRK